MTHRRKIMLPLLAAALAAAAALVPAAAARAEPLVEQEYEIKAAYIYNFTKFVEWPVHGVEERPFVIAVVGSDPFGSALPNAVTDRTVGGRPIAIERYPDFASLKRADARPEILYIALPADSLPATIAYLGRRPVLTIGESPEFCARGGAINFVTRRNRVRFEINARAAELAGVRMSSKLLRLAAPAGEGE